MEGWLNMSCTDNLDCIRKNLEEKNVIRNPREWNDYKGFIKKIDEEGRMSVDELCEKISRVILAERSFLTNLKSATAALKNN